MTITEFKALCETLGRFASVREKAPEPEDRILVTAQGGSLSFTAGTEGYSVTATVGETSDTGWVVVPSRMLLASAKALRGRGEVDVRVEPNVVTLLASTGGKVILKALTSVRPEFTRPTKKAEARFVARHPGLLVASRVFEAATSKYTPSDRVFMEIEGDRLTFAGTDDRTLARWGLDAGRTHEGRATLGSLPRGLFSALRGLEEPGTLAWGAGRVAIRSGRFLVGALVGGEVRDLSLPDVEADVRVEVDRKALMDALQSMRGEDANARACLVAGRRGFEVADWTGGGSMLLTADAQGNGKVALNAARARGLLAALPGRRACIEFDGSQPRPIRLSTEETRDWTLLLAPVVS